jgi:hypothetical protein
MIVIAHRGNRGGPNPTQENNPSYINDALNYGYDVEIDVWHDNGWWLGHDTPQYKTSLKWILYRQTKLWIHCKNIDAMYRFADKQQKVGVGYLNYFWHQNDDCVLTSRGFIWTYPGKPLTKLSIAVLPETVAKYDDHDLDNCWGICSDYTLGL